VRWILAGALAALAATAQAPPPPQNPAPEQPPTFKTEANYVRVDLYPTADGKPILDLRQDEIKVLEDGVVQKIDAFEHVVVRAAGPQETRHEPNTVAESRAALENPRARVFVVFLDVYHVEVGGSHNIRKPLIDTLNRIIGSEDLVGVMTPEMSATDVTFARRTTTIEGMLTRYWTWGERDQINTKDPEEQQYLACYPGNPPSQACPDDDRGVAKEMIYRRREKRTIDALQDLVRFLRGAREERKAVIAITDGWRLYRPNPSLERRLNCQLPTGAPVSTDPRTGKLGAGGAETTRNPNGAVYANCERDRLNLARIDNADEFRRIQDEANRANTSFYPVDPRGLAVFDEQIVPPIPDSVGRPAPMVPVSIDAALLSARLDSLRTLAGATDGIAVVNSNDLNRGLQRIVDDLTSYYLLGYYSSGKLDGKFHSIKVRVKRPGVDVRARRGYLAATAAEAEASRAAAAAVTPEAAAAAAERAIVDTALAPLGKFQRETPFNIRVAGGWKPGSPPTPVVFVAGELSANAAFAPDWREGATADIVMKVDDGSPAGATVATTQIKLDPGTRSFRTALSAAEPLAPGDYTIRVTARGAAGALPSSDVMRIALPEAPRSVGALLARRGPATINRDVPTADLRFRRTEQIRIDIPTAASSPMTGRLLDRTGKALPLAVVTALRDDPDGSRWMTARVTLAPLAPGDYIVELTRPDGAGGAGGGRETERMLVAFRVVP
jgi:VWFA-related protein